MNGIDSLHITVVKMPNNQRRKSEATDTDTELVAETELNKLRHQYRVLEEDRRIYSDKAQQIIRRQQEEINSLQREREEIETNMALALSHKNLVMDGHYSVELKYLLQKKEEYDSLIDSEKTMRAKLDAEIQEMEKVVSEQRKITGGLPNVQLHRRRLQKQTQALENRLHQATVHFDKLLTKNAKLRGEIEHLRIRRTIFENFSQKLNKELAHQKKNMEDFIETSIQAYEQRAEAQARMSVVKERSLKDLIQFDTEIKELRRTIEHEAKLKAFMQIKFAERTDIEEEDSAILKGKAAAENKAMDKSGEESSEDYQVAQQRLTKLTGHDDIDYLINKFTEDEEKNFASFSYVNLLNSEVEALYEKIQNIKNEMLQLQSQKKHTEDVVHSNLKELEEKLQKTTQEADLYECRYKDTSKILDQLKSGIQLLFKKIHCDPTSIEEMLGGSSGVTDTNIMKYLGGMEKKVNELLLIEAMSYLKKPEYQSEISVLPSNPLLGGSGLLHTVTPIKINPPWISETYDEDALEDKILCQPMDYPSLQGKVLQSIHCRRQLTRRSPDKVVESHSPDSRRGRDKKRATTV